MGQRNRLAPNIDIAQHGRVEEFKEHLRTAETEMGYSHFTFNIIVISPLIN
jgi:hypothetical protein